MSIGFSTESPTWELPSLTSSPASTPSEYAPLDVDARRTAKLEQSSSSSSTSDEDDYLPLQVSKPRSPQKKPSPLKRRTMPLPPAPTRTGVQRTSRSNKSKIAPYPTPPSSRASSPSSPSLSLSEGALIRTAPRMSQASLPFVPLSPSERASVRCPVCAETFNRAQDVPRHHAGHFPASTPAFVCAGVRVECAAAYGVAGGEERVFRGERRVGGACWRVFSRQDALVRHLRMGKKGCVGEAVPPGEWRRKSIV